MRLACAPVVLVMVAAALGNAGALNPDGYSGHPSIALYGSAVRETDRHEGLPGYWPEYTTHADAGAGGVELTIPFNRHLSGSFGYALSSGVVVQHAFYIGASVYTRGVDRPSELLNPDGREGGLAITPLVGFNVANIGGSSRNSLREHGAVAGVRIAYVATRVLTTYAAALYNKSEHVGASTVTAGARLHLNHRPPADGAFNPDGRPGSVCVEPVVFRVIAPGRTSGLCYGLDLTVPVFTHLSVVLTGQYATTRGDRYTGTQAGGGFGLTVHL